MSKRQEFCLALHHLALTFFVICALPLWYLTGILSDVPPDVSADALHAGRRQLVILFAVFTVIFLIGMIVFRLGRLPRSKFQIAALIVLSFIGLLIGKCMNHPLQEASLRQSAYTIFLLYLSYAIAQLGMIAVLHPVSVDEIIRTGEAAGGASGEYVGRLTSDTADHPLGMYFFTSADKSQWYYYDVLTGEAAADYHSSYEPA